MNYLINAWVEKGVMVYNNALSGGLEAYQRGVILTNFFGENGKQLRNFLEVINALSHQ